VADVIAALTMSLDGFIAHDDDSVGHLFDWYDSGDVAVRWPVDEIAVDLAPVLLGRGIRFFHEIAHAPVLLEDPEVRESVRVTHLRFRVRHRNA
jgi:hypothetical protein